ncbi:photosystem II protein PsbQ [Fulvimonas sp. R45]|uniref:photosystem II protein PsbQ n=1 Tax=Fulvimonas sp. R45 TaxID=3045937 RepID=UPI00265EDE0A|nr:photosystem II protein PsbQ [Fulvimonas sp. R45]MDO1530575.1 photosystem II protein PsbQ [Fulvimonas sp. R45]
MRRRTGLLALGLLAAPFLATGAQADHAKAPPTRPHEAVSRLDRDIAARKAEVARLRQGVAQQESQSREAATRLQQQDRDIAELKRQLQALKAAPAAGH